MNTEPVYLDHAATSWPKPPEVIRAMTDFLERAGANPGRSGHRLSIEAGRIVYEAREALSEFLNAPDPARVIFTHNATHALNIALFGLLKPGDTVVATSMEHNSVMRPLRELERRGVSVRVTPCSPQGVPDWTAYEQALADGPRLVALVHASNVSAHILPVEELARAAHRAGALVLVDAAQSVGVMPVDVQAMGADLLALTGHKGLQGPPGVGALVLAAAVDPREIEPLMRGGTGSSSGSDEQPEALPDRYESGTPNGVGIAGLGAGLRWVREQGLERIAAHHDRLMRRLVEGLAAIPGVRAYGPPARAPRAPLASFVVEGVSVSQVGRMLDERYGVLCRVGLHCAPAAHRTIDTYPEGTVRFAVGPMNTGDDIERALEAVKGVARR